jgi:hypothetical protein
MPYAPSNGMGVAALSLGITGSVVFCLWPLAAVLGVLAVIFGAIGRGKARRGEADNPGQALAGIICGVAAMVLAVVAAVFYVTTDDTEDSDDPFDDSYSTTLVVMSPASEPSGP